MTDFIEFVLRYSGKALERFKSIILISAGFTSVIWFYFDLVVQDVLVVEEVIGFYLIFFVVFLFVRYAFCYVRKYFLVLICTFILLPNLSIAADFRVIDIPSSGVHRFDLKKTSLYRFPFTLSELSISSWVDDDPENIDCLTYEKFGSDKLRLEFCGYGSAYRNGTGSVIVGSDGKTAYAYDLLDLEAGGGGNFGRVLQVPSTKLRDYLSSNQLDIELLSKAFMSSDSSNYSVLYSGYGLYAFILFRENSISGRQRRQKVVRSFYNILPEFSIDTFGLKEKDVALMLLPTVLNDVEIYRTFNLELVANGKQYQDEGEFFVDTYNYAYATKILKKIRQKLNADLPAMSVVFVGSTGKPFSISNFEWSNAIIFDLDKEKDLDGFFIELNKQLTYGLTTRTSINFLDQIRSFARSTGRLALLLTQ